MSFKCVGVNILSNGAYKQKAGDKSTGMSACFMKKINTYTETGNVARPILTYKVETITDTSNQFMTTSFYIDSNSSYHSTLHDLSN